MGITLSGDDSGALARAAANVEREMRQLPGLGTITSSASLQQPEIVIRPLADRAADLGVTTETLSLVTRIATSGDVDTGLCEVQSRQPPDPDPRAAQRQVAHEPRAHQAARRTRAPAVRCR